jgi:hypothetical protein
MDLVCLSLQQLCLPTWKTKDRAATRCPHKTGKNVRHSGTNMCEEGFEHTVTVLAQVKSHSRCIGVITINIFHIIHEKLEVVFQERG